MVRVKKGMSGFEMSNMNCLYAVATATALLLMPAGASAQVMPDLVSRTAFRVCSDPSNLPFSNKKLQGFENKIAEIFATAFKKPIRYFWAPSGPGFIRNTLNNDLCDVVMGYTVGAELVLSTNPYYRSTYVLVAPKDSILNGIESIEDQRLKGRRLGVFGGSPPVDVMTKKGLVQQARVYPLLVDHRFDSPLTDILSDLKEKKVDAAVVWGPLIGDAVKESKGALVMTPLLKDIDKPGFAYRISLGVRHDETEWKHKLEDVLRTRKADIDKVLVDYNVPLLDNSGKLIGADQAKTGAAPVIEPAADGGARAGRPMPAPTPKGFAMPGPAPTNR